MADASGANPDLLPPKFQAWFAGRGWAPRAHQLEMVEKARAGRDVRCQPPLKVYVSSIKSAWILMFV